MYCSGLVADGMILERGYGYFLNRLDIFHGLFSDDHIFPFHMQL